MKNNDLYRFNVTGLALLLLLALTLSGFDGNTIALLATSTATPNLTPTPTVTPTPTPLTAAEIFARVSPSVAFIETPTTQGSGVLIEDGYIVTNAHLVWPFEKVRVVFPDGTEWLDAPVVNWDLLADLAIIGPLVGSGSPLALVDGEDLIIGSDVFLVGYPGEVEPFPQPTITRGLISRRREWEPIEMTYFQTDAVIAAGQSGGVLVSEEGEVIGISGFFFTETGFGLVASAGDVLPRVQRLIAGEDITGLGDRRLSLEEGQLEHDFTLHNEWDIRMYVVNEPMGTSVDIEVEGEQDVAFGLVDMFGNVVAYADDGISGVEAGSATTELAAPYFVVSFQNLEEPGNFRVRSNRMLVPYNDVDDGATVTLGQTLPANIDHPFDFDYYVIDLARGDTINISVDSASIDPLVYVDFLGAMEEEVASDDNSGGGLFGLDAQLTYRAPHDGSYFIVVQVATGSDVGGYLLTVAEASPGATPVEPRPAPASIVSPYGPMTLYESAQYPFAIQYPAEWTEQPPQVEVGETARFISESEQGGALVITEEDMLAQGFGETTLEEYGDAVLSIVESSLPDFQLVSREEIVTPQGLPAGVVEFTIQGGFLKITRFFYLHEGQIAFNATYLAPGARHDELEPLIEYSLDTFRVQDAELYLDQGVQLLDSGEVEMAIETFTQAIELDPSLAEAYINRARAYGQMGNVEAALADMTTAIELRPDDPELYNTRAHVHWVLLDDQNALVDVEQALQLDPEYDDAYNHRALIFATQGKYEEALADVATALELRPTANADLLDTRGYIYLKDEQYEKAKADFEEIFSRGLEFPYALLGGGLAYAALEESDKALDLLERGLEEAKEIKAPDPQMADLIELAEPTRSNLRIPVLAGSEDCPPDCSQTDLSGADLPGANLFSADLSLTNLSGTNLARADLRQADLSSANLSEANLTGADLSGADLSEARLQEAVYDEITGWPTDFDPDRAGALVVADAVEKYIDQGLANYDAGDLEEAIRDFGQALELDPDAVQAYSRRGIANLDSGNPEQALLDFNLALDRDPELVEAYFGRGAAYQALDELGRAIADYDLAIDLDPTYTEAYLKRGIAYGALNELDRAIADFDRAIELDPGNAEAYNFRGVAYEREGDYERAIAEYDRAIELDPEFAMAYGNRAYSYSQLGNYEQVLADGSKMIELEPDFPYAYSGRGWAYARLGDYERAIADYTKAIELLPDFVDAYLSRGLAYDELGEYEQAIADNNQAIQIDPAETYAYNNRGWTYYLMGDYEQAIADYTQAMELDPSNPDFTAPYNNRGWIYYLQEDYDRALADFNQAIELSPSADAFIYRAVVYDAVGDSEQAARDFDQAIEHYDGEPVDAHNYLAWTLVHDLDTHYEQALTHAQRSVELESRADNNDTLALVYYKLEQYDKALEHYDLTLALDAEQLASIKSRGDVYLAQGDMGAAVADYQTYLSLVSERPAIDIIGLQQVIENLEQYLELEPEGEHREAAISLIAELEALLPLQPLVPR